MEVTAMLEAKGMLEVKGMLEAAAAAAGYVGMVAAVQPPAA
jgi:hypothetical protein